MRCTTVFSSSTESFSVVAADQETKVSRANPTERFSGIICCHLSSAWSAWRVSWAEWAVSGQNLVSERHRQRDRQCPPVSQVRQAWWDGSRKTGMSGQGRAKIGAGGLCCCSLQPKHGVTSDTAGRANLQCSQHCGHVWSHPRDLPHFRLVWDHRAHCPAHLTSSSYKQGTFTFCSDKCHVASPWAFSATLPDTARFPFL